MVDLPDPWVDLDRTFRKGSAVYIGVGTLVVVLLIVLIVYFLRRA